MPNIYNISNPSGACYQSILSVKYILERMFVDNCLSPLPIPSGSASMTSIFGCNNNSPPLPPIRSANKLSSGTGEILMRMGRRVSQAFNLRLVNNKVTDEGARSNKKRNH
ncbi:hypothetical protein ACTXT7_005024 [Hymenolepis weldensis]